MICSNEYSALAMDGLRPRPMQLYHRPGRKPRTTLLHDACCTYNTRLGVPARHTYLLCDRSNAANPESLTKHCHTIEFHRRNQRCQAQREVSIRGTFRSTPTCRPQPSCTAKSTLLRTPARIRKDPFIAWHTFLYGQAHRDDHSGRVEEPLAPT